MKRATIRYGIPLLALAASAAGPVSAMAASKTARFAGPVEQQGHWGPIQVTITVKNKKITNVTAVNSPHTPRSSVIESNALPVLKQEVLQAQSANIDIVSGATYTSESYVRSLQGAIDANR